jgi:hypothetical protein
VTASGPTAFYLIELGRVVVPVAGISFVLVAVLCSQGLGKGRARLWLIVVTGMWLLVTFANRLLLIAPIRSHFFRSAPHDYATAHQAGLYFAMGAYLWIAEQILLFAFGILLFFAVRSNARRDI